MLFAIALYILAIVISQVAQALVGLVPILFIVGTVFAAIDLLGRSPE